MIITVDEAQSAENARGRICFSVSLSDGTHSEKKELVCFLWFLKRQQSLDGRIPQAGETITEHAYDALLTASAQTAAAVKSVDFLAYSDLTARRLREKLRRKGFDEEAISGAILFLEEKGYLRENDYLERFVHSLCEKKHYGVRRIRQEIFQKGFDQTLVKEQLPALLEELDFEEALSARVRALKPDACETPEKRKKVFASLMRYGFLPEEIRQALKELAAEDDEEDEELSEDVFDDDIEL